MKSVRNKIRITSLRADNNELSMVWFAARPSGTENIYKTYAKSFRGAAHLRRILAEAQTIVRDALAAVRDGKSMDTSMSFTPTAGVPMSTRSGDLDPGLVWYLTRTGKMSAKQFNEMVNLQSGLLGISETGSDMRDLLERETQDVRAAQAIAMFCYQIKKWIGAFAAAIRVAVRVIRTDEERVVVCPVCRVLGLG